MVVFGIMGEGGDGVWAGLGVRAEFWWDVGGGVLIGLDWVGFSHI